MDKVVLVERLPYPRATLGKPTLHSIYLILTASVYMAYFTFASGSRVPLRGKFFHVNTLTRLPETTPWERFNMIG